jgi:hypothetical protein
MEIKPQKTITLYKCLFSYTFILLIPLIPFTYLINQYKHGKNQGNLVLPWLYIIHDSMGVL